MSLSIALGLAPFTSARSQDSTQTATWSLEQIIDGVRTSNPALEQAHQTYLAAKQLVPQATALPNPQISLLEQANTGGPFDFNSSSGFYAYFTLTQPLLWPGKRHLQGEVAEAQANVASAQYDVLLLQLISAARLGYYQLLDLKAQLRFMNEDLERLQQIKELAKTRYANNAAAYVDFLNAQVAASSLENDLFALQKQIQSITEQINVLAGRSAMSPLEIEDAALHPHLPPEPLADLLKLALQANPGIAASGYQVEAANKSVALARKGFLPDFQLTAGTYSDPSVVRVDTEHVYSIGIGLTLPTWGFAKEKASLAQSEAQLDAARAGDASSRRQLELSVSNAYHDLETAIRQIDFTRSRLLPQAQMAYQLALNAYSSAGNFAFSDLLTAQSGLRSTEMSVVQSQNAALQSYVNLVAAIGRDPG